MTTTFIAKAALEIWRASGVRTLERLDALVDHFANVYALTMPYTLEAREIARSLTRDWEIAR